MNTTEEKVMRALKKLNVSYNPVMSGMAFEEDVTMVWVFKKKRNGVYRARLVGLGYSQILGVDHKDNFSPVVTDTTFRCVLIIALSNEWNMEVVDIERAFLYGVLDEEIYMKIPEGLEDYMGTGFEGDECLDRKSSCRERV